MLGGENEVLLFSPSPLLLHPTEILSTRAFSICANAVIHLEPTILVAASIFPSTD